MGMSLLNRRELIGAAAVTSVSIPFSKAESKATNLADYHLRLAVIGCANRGGAIGGEAVRHQLTHCVALCDVVPSRAEGFKKKHQDRCSDAVIYDDFRKMFEELGDKIDACTIGTPDHSHFPIAMLAMSMGIHVYVEKPLAHTFEECELLMAAEKNTAFNVRWVTKGTPVSSVYSSNLGSMKESSRMFAALTPV